MKRISTTTILILFSTMLFAQGDSGTNNFFASNLKIFVPVGVLTIILLCLFVFLFDIEKRLKKLEDAKN